MKRSVIILIFVLYFTTFSYADECVCSLTFGIYTYHYESGSYTEKLENRLIAFEYKNWTFANFVNSYGKETQFAGYGWHTKKFYAVGSEHLWVRGNIYLGILIGYGKDHPVHLGAVSPGAYPTGSMGYDRYSIEVGLMPGFVWTGFKVEF